MPWSPLHPATPPAWPSGSRSGLDSGSQKRCPCAAATYGSTRIRRCSACARTPRATNRAGAVSSHPLGSAEEPGRPGALPLQGPKPSHAGHLPAVGRGSDEACRRGCQTRSRPSPPPRFPPHLRPQLRPPRGPTAGPAAVAGTSIPCRHTALCSWPAPIIHGSPSCRAIGPV